MQFNLQPEIDVEQETVQHILEWRSLPWAQQLRFLSTCSISFFTSPSPIDFTYVLQQPIQNTASVVKTRTRTAVAAVSYVPAFFLKRSSSQMQWPDITSSEASCTHHLQPVLFSENIWRTITSRLRNISAPCRWAWPATRARQWSCGKRPGGRSRGECRLTPRR